MGSDLLIRSKGGDSGEVVSVVPNGREWKYVGFRVLRMAAGTQHAAQTDGDEVVLVFIEGTAEVRAANEHWNGVGKRASPFDGPPQAIYVPPDTTYIVEARTGCEIAICSAAARGSSHSARLLALEEGDAHTRGTGHAQRRVYNILMDPGAAASLFVTEVVTPAGNWSSYPPHKHDTDNPPVESQLEEIYYYRARPSAGFAFQRVYTADGALDETMTAYDRDVILVPRGYHVCAAAAEYSIYYLNVLAGPRHVYHMTFDPAHEWIKEGWTW
jgi:5-deoxy-glucuronate isomerase